VGTGAANSPYGVLQGTAVALSADGNTALVGGPNDNQVLGATWVFTRTNSTWTQQGSKLVGSGAVISPNGAAQGASASLSADGNTALLGAPYDSNNAGAAWVFTRSKGAWTQQGQKLIGNGAVGSPTQGFGVALSGDGNTALIGGPNDDSKLGAAWVFVATPAVTKLNPTTGPAKGGTDVTISGRNLTGATAVKFGTTDAVSVTVKNATTIVARAPKHPKGSVNVTVTTSAGSGSKAGSFTFD
ncbi:MAG TPA: IPT/TIG domain-containing protein, partial [Pseudolabrys sp.]|nr:IPT/TIG domain-containing protein [Pseudolabrys sp.]